MIVIGTMALRRNVPHQAAFEASYQAHFPRVFQLGLRYGGGDTAFAEDVAHDVFCKLLTHLPTLSAHEDLGGWLYRVATHQALSRLRQRRTFRQWLSRALDSEPEPELAPAPDEALESRRLAQAAMGVLRQLPPKERVVLSMKLLDGLSQQEIAQILSMSKGYVSKLVARGVAALRAAGWEVDDGAP